MPHRRSSPVPSSPVTVRAYPDGMAAGWATRWTRIGKNIVGGQGISFPAQDVAGRLGFVKELKRQRDSRARARFLREVTSYETLEGHESLPKLLEHNAIDWKNTAEPLFLVLEMIEGGTLADYARKHGSCDLVTAAKLVSRLTELVQYCHENDVVHRDLKPANILLRNGDPADPVIVDFGLSFNEIDEEQDLTRVNEEVGNRFLRLPEHATGGRSPVSDVSQLVGLLLFLLTATEPRVLMDDEGRMPHQRESSKVKLRAAVEDDAQYRRLLGVFDRGFRPMTTSRFQTAAQLREAIEQVMTPEPEVPDLEDLLQTLDRDVAMIDRQRVADAAMNIGEFRQILYREIRGVAASRSLEVSWGNGPDEFASDPPFGVLRFALTVPGVIPDKFVEFRVELRGESDYVVVLEADEIWRGQLASDDVLTREVFRPLVSLFASGSKD